MHESLLPILRCPVDGGTLSLTAAMNRAEDGELLEGVLCCDSCRRWFRIEEGIADLVRDGLREEEEDRRFLERHQAALPEELLQSGVPVSLKTPPLSRSEADQRIVDEGRHWGRFMRHFWDAGDRSIFDLRVRGEHPRFLVAGIRERDERDRKRPYAGFPTAAGCVLFSRLEALKGLRAIDVGCGGGQFSLAFAAEGLDVVGVDPSFEELRLARIHARSTGVRTVDYVRAEPEHPPFARESFDVFLAKDALHHIPNLSRVMEESLLPLLRDGASAIIQEHVGKSAAKRAALSRIAPPLVAKMRRRYPAMPVPEELLRDSANEDVAMAEVRAALYRAFRTDREWGALWLYLDVEALVYFAFGKRAWFATLWRGAAWVLEQALRLREPVEHWSFRGTLRKRPLPPPPVRR